MLSMVQDWLKAQKQTDWKTLLAENVSSREGKLVFENVRILQSHKGALYLHSMPKSETEDLLLFMVPKAHCVAMLNVCY